MIPGVASGLDGLIVTKVYFCNRLLPKFQSIDFLEKTLLQVTAGDSHTTVLTADGRVFACGLFRVSSIYL